MVKAKGKRLLGRVQIVPVVQVSLIRVDQTLEWDWHQHVEASAMKVDGGDEAVQVSIAECSAFE